MNRGKISAFVFANSLTYHYMYAASGCLKKHLLQPNMKI